MTATLASTSATTTPLSRAATRIRILVLATPFPSCNEPTRCIFIKERVDALAALSGIEVRVVSPVPWFPPIRRFPRWYKWSQYPREEVLDGLSICHPRYLLPPKLGGYIHPRLMYSAAKRAADRLRDSGFDFDVIDAHFVYPNGVVGAMLARRYGLPVVMTGRGEDMLRFPDMPFKGKSIRWALKQASRCVALSQEIAEAMQRHGADPEKVTVIPNGVDTEKFRPLPQRECREKLGLPLDAKIILSVGDRLELKGFHLLVDAMPRILRTHPTAFLVIVGGPGRFGRDYTAKIKKRIERHSLQDRVLLAGARPHSQLPLWYNAANLFALLSSREGSPNVLLEALACGTPAVGATVGGISDELANPQMGLLLPDRCITTVERTICRALGAPWDRESIWRAMEKRCWESTAKTVVRHFGSVLQHGRTLNG